MTNLFQDATDWLTERLKYAAGRSVTYSRGGISSATITAVPALHDYTVVNDEGLVTVVRVQDWLFAAEDLVLRGETITPRPADRIIEPLQGDVITYEVLPPDGGPCYEWSDAGAHLLLVHSKRVE